VPSNIWDCLTYATEDGGRAKIDEITDLTYSKGYDGINPLTLHDDSLLMIRGWAMAARQNVPVLAVGCIIDRQPPMRGIYGFPRLDVEHAYCSRSARNCEFRFYLSSGGLTEGLNDIEILVVEAERGIYRKACSLQLQFVKVPNIGQTAKSSQSC
jgi:hypothetical protein